MTNDPRRDRIERRVFALLDSRAAVAPARSARWRFLALSAVVSVSAAAMAILVARIWLRPHAGVTRSAMITPLGGSSRLVVGQTVLDAGSDTWLEVETSAGGAVTVRLARGSVSGDLSQSRLPFAVQAGDTKVLVTGSQFRISRRAEVQVSVLRGNARIERGLEHVALSAGNDWATGPDAAAAREAPPAVPGSL